MCVLSMSLSHQLVRRIMRDGCQVCFVKFASVGWWLICDHWNGLVDHLSMHFASALLYANASYYCLNCDSGQAWKAAELRNKSWEDLHALWYILLKERNLLESEKLRVKAAKERLQNPSRLTKVFLPTPPKIAISKHLSLGVFWGQ